MVGDNPMFGNHNMWSEYMKFQAPAIQNMMTSYLEQSTNMFVEMQNQMQTRTKTCSAAFPSSPTPALQRQRSEN